MLVAPLPIFPLMIHNPVKTGTQRAEASTCRSAIRTAKGVVRDIGKESAAKSPGLNELARCSQKNSERDFQNVTSKKFLLSLPIDLSTIQKPPGMRYSGDFHAISLRNWCQFLVTYSCWHIVCGLVQPNPPRERAILQEFWRRYRLWRPNHDLWQLVDSRGIDLSRMAPMVLHGDEGRGFKKSAFLLCAYHSYIGRGTNAANSTRTSRPYVSMKLNYGGNSWSHRFVTACLPKMNKDERAFQAICDFMTEDALDLINNGVVGSDGTKYHMAVLQCSGDWQWLVKAGSLSRSYSNCEKRPRAANAQPKGICHYCLAGQAGVPFEDFRRQAVWRRTQFQPGDCPFTSVPSMLRLPHEGDKPSRFFTYDLWHSYHLGMGKCFLGSALAVISEHMDGSNIELRFQNLTTIFLQWAEDSRTTPFISTLSKEGIQWPDKKSYPNGNWHKGHVTTVLMKFVVWFLETRNYALHDASLMKILEAARAMNEAMTILFSNDVWLPKVVANQVGRLGRRHMELYQEMATASFRQGEALWPFMPKSHVCDHIWSELEFCEAPYCISPLCHSVQVDEDMVGRVSRVSRRVSPMQVIKRVLQRTLHASFAHFVNYGYLHSR